PALSGRLRRGYAGGVLSRPDSYGHYRGSLRPCSSAPIAPWRRATFRQALLRAPERGPDEARLADLHDAARRTPAVPAPARETPSLRRLRRESHRAAGRE